MGGFPADEAKAFGVISMGSAIAALSKATKVIVKTPHEAVGIPTMEANAEGLRCTKQVINMLRDQEYSGAAVEAEKEIIRAETVCILEKCLELGGGDIYKTDLKGRIAIVIGGEDTGVNKLTQKKCDAVMSIPMYGKVNSLNASVACGIGVFEALRQRKNV